MKAVNEMIDELVATIRRICKEKQISITQMENDLGFSAGLISRWSKTKTSPSFDKIVAIMDYLHITYDQLMSGSQADESEAPAFEQAGKDNVCEKLLEDSERGRIQWFDACGDETFLSIYKQFFSDGIHYHVHRIYYTMFGEGYFLIALQCNENTLKMKADLYMISEDGFEPKLMSDTGGYAKKLLKYADNHLYTEWAQRKAEKMVTSYMEY